MWQLRPRMGCRAMPAFWGFSEWIRAARLAFTLQRVQERFQWARLPKAIWSMARLRLRKTSDKVKTESTAAVPFSALRLPSRAGIMSDPPPLPCGDKRSRMVPQLVSRILILLIRIYQTLVPNRVKRKCLYTPTCSQYAIAAIRAVGPIEGVRAAGRRRGSRPKLSLSK